MWCGKDKNIMPAQALQIITVIADIVLVIFLLYSLLRFRRKEKELAEKEKKIETTYQDVTNGALAKEKQLIDGAMNQANKILDVTTNQANQIIQGAQFISQNSMALLNQAVQKMVIETQNIGSISKITLEQALQKIVVDIQKEALDVSRNSVNSYSTSLKAVTTQSISDLQIIAKGLEVDLQKQISDFNQSLLPKLEKEVEEYKALRLKQSEQMVNKIIQKATQEIFGRIITLADHQNIMIESLERAKREGVFDQ